jgi:hypothetical protein
VAGPVVTPGAPGVAQVYELVDGVDAADGALGAEAPLSDVLDAVVDAGLMPRNPVVLPLLLPRRRRVRLPDMRCLPGGGCLRSNR